MPTVREVGKIKQKIKKGMISALKECVPAFEITWLEVLGEIARYRAAVQDDACDGSGMWTTIARNWYAEAAAMKPQVGWIKHQIAVLASPNSLQQLFHFSQALSALEPLASTEISIHTLLNPFIGEAFITQCSPMEAEFLKAQGLLLGQSLHAIPYSNPWLLSSVGLFLSLLDAHVSQVATKWLETGVWVAFANILSLLSATDTKIESSLEELGPNLSIRQSDLCSLTSQCIYPFGSQASSSYDKSRLTLVVLLVNRPN
jgi:hypothetical protein